MARPTKFNQERAEAICEALRQGSTRKAAYGAAGVSHETFANWLIRFPVFLEAVTRAEAEAENACAAAICAAIRTDWRAAESWLKRRRRDEWGDSLDLRKLSDEQIIRLLEAEAGAGSDPAGLAGAGLLPANGNGKH